MTADNSNVLKLHGAPPLRASIARLSQNYPALLASTLRDGQLIQGGEPARAMNTPEKRGAAVNIAAQLFASFFYHRVVMERKIGEAAPGLYGFFHDTADRINHHVGVSLGAGHTAVLTPEDANVPVHAFHTNIVQAVFGAWRFEMTQEEPDEPAFWRRVFLGFSDVEDPSGVLAEAARLVYLDYSDEFAAALRQDEQLAG